MKRIEVVDVGISLLCGVYLTLVVLGSVSPWFRSLVGL